MIRCGAALFVAGLLCACGGNGSAFDERTASSDRLANVCAAPRSGNDPYDGNKPYPDRPGTLADERRWLRAYMDEIYLWYREIPDVDDARYTAERYGSVPGALDAYFEALKTPRLTASGKREDAFSFTYPTAEYDALSRSGVFLSYGLQFAALSRSPPRDYRVAYTEPARPAGNLGVERGARVLAIDGVDIDDDSAAGIDALNAGLFPQTEGEQHRFRFADAGGGEYEVVLTAAAVTETPVQNVHTVATASGSVGYLLFNDHIATAEGGLIDAVRTLRDAGVDDLVLDIRYNGGGYLDIASELAYMIAGQARTEGRLFERLSFNDKNPLAGSSTARTPFHDEAQGFDPAVREGEALPQLGLSRVFVLTGPGTCSASEAVINGLRGVGVEVVLVGDTSCGKPYGFFQQDNCGLSYFAIEFQGVNDQGFGDYADGFPPDCAVADDFAHALGDPDEGLFAAALAYRQSGGCPVGAKRAAAPLQLLRSPLRENRWLRPPR